MAIADDVSIDFVNKFIDQSGAISGSQFYTAQALYSYAMEVFAAAGGMDDDIPMSGETPSDFTMRNGWYITQRLVQHLKGGSVQSNGYNGQVQLVKFSTLSANFVSGDRTKVMVVGGFSGVILDYDNTKRYAWVRATGTAANSTAMTVTSGTGAGTTAAASACITGEELFGNLYTLGTIANGNIMVLQGSAIITAWWGVGNSDGAGGSTGNHVDILVKVKEAGSLLNSGDLTILNRNYGDTYDHGGINLASGGRNAVPLATATDINNATAEGTITNYVDSAGNMGGVGSSAQIRVDFGAYTADIDDDGTLENYGVRVDCDGERLTRVYEALKWLCDKDRGGSTVLNAIFGQIYISASPGSYTPVKASPFGTFAGGKFFGARGVYLINLDPLDASNYQTVDNANVSKTPPSTMTVKVSQLVSGLVVGVFQLSGGLINKAMFTSHNTANVSTDTTFEQIEAIPNDTPAAGYFRVVKGAIEDRYRYSSYNRTTKVYTLHGDTPTLVRTYDNTWTVYVPYIDEQAAGTSVSKSLKYVADRDVVVVVRKGTTAGKIVPYKGVSAITATGMDVPAQAIPDIINTNA